MLSILCDLKLGPISCQVPWDLIDIALADIISLFTMQALEEVRELTEFSAIIYSSFDRDNVRGSC